MASRPEAFTPPSMRPMTGADLPRVEFIERAGQAAPWSRGIFRDCLEAGYDCRVILDGDGIIGFVVVSSVLDEAHLLNIVLDTPWQGYGIARQVLKTLLDQLARRGITLVYLEVREGNTPARTLYDRLGFRENGFRHNYYRTAEGGRESAVLMVKELASVHK